MKQPHTIASLSDAEQIELLKKQLQRSEAENALLREMLRLERIRKYEPGSEKLSSSRRAISILTSSFGWSLEDAST